MIRKVTLELTDKEFETLRNMLYEKGSELEDDGREGHPDALVLYKVARQLKESKQ